MPTQWMAVPLSGNLSGNIGMLGEAKIIIQSPPVPHLGDKVVAEARSWLGTPYLHQASKKGVGCDCLGLIRGVWRALYADEPEHVPAYSGDWAEWSKHEPMLEAARRHFIELSQPITGALILFRWHNRAIVKHAGIYTGSGRFIHAYERAGTVETHLGSVWRARIVASFCFPSHLTATR